MTKQRILSSLDGQINCRATVSTPDRYRQLLSADAPRPMSVQGAGLSITAASFGDGGNVINTSRFNRFLSFDADRGFVEVESGVTLGDLHDFLTPRGFYLTVQPGHYQITVGGCIAANVHGKNPYRDGTFRDVVDELRLYHPNHGEKILSETKDRDLFELTCGGLGLTGIIVSARIWVMPLKGNGYRVSHYPVASLHDATQQINGLGEDYDLLYSWHNLSRFDDRMGEGYLVAAEMASFDPPPKSPSRLPQLQARPLDPLTLPIFNDWSLPVANWMYKNFNKNMRDKPHDIVSTHFPWWNKRHYFRAFGRRGFVESQTLIPEETFQAFIGSFEKIVRESRIPFALALLKRFRGTRSFLRFIDNGYSITLHVRGGRDSTEMLDRIDKIAIEHKAISSVYKDSRLTRDVVRRQYEGYDTFRDALHQYDPDRLFVTDLSERLGI